MTHEDVTLAGRYFHVLFEKASKIMFIIMARLIGYFFLGIKINHLAVTGKLVPNC